MKKRFAPACILVPGFVVGFKKEVISILHQKSIFLVDKATFWDPETGSRCMEDMWILLPFNS